MGKMELSGGKYTSDCTVLRQGAMNGLRSLRMPRAASVGLIIRIRINAYVAPGRHPTLPLCNVESSRADSHCTFDSAEAQMRPASARRFIALAQ